MLEYIGALLSASLSRSADQFRNTTMTTAHTRAALSTSEQPPLTARAWKR